MTTTGDKITSGFASSGERRRDRTSYLGALAERAEDPTTQIPYGFYESVEATKKKIFGEAVLKATPSQALLDSDWNRYASPYSLFD